MASRSFTGLAPLENRDFRLLFTGSAVGHTMMPLQFLTQIFWVQETAPENVWLLLVSLIGASRGVGALTFGLYGGALADRFDRRKLLMVSQALLLITTVLIAALMHFSDGEILGFALFYLLTFVSAGMFSIDAPTRMAITPDILGRDLTPAGMSLNQAAIQLSMPLAILASGFVIDEFGYSGAYFLSALGHLAVLGALVPMKYRKSTSTGPAGTYGFGRIIRDIREGLGYARHEPVVLWTIVLMFALMGIGFPATSNLGPTWITTVVGVEIRWVGLVAMSWGIGAFASAVVMMRYASFERRGILIAAGAVTFSVAFVIFVADHSVINAVIGNLGLGVGMTMASLSSTILVQHRVPNEIRGRIMSLFQLNMGFAQLMTLPVAALAQWLTLQVLFPWMALTLLVIVLSILASQRQIWHARILLNQPPQAG